MKKRPGVEPKVRQMVGYPGHVTEGKRVAVVTTPRGNDDAAIPGLVYYLSALIEQGWELRGHIVSLGPSGDLMATLVRKEAAKAKKR